MTISHISLITNPELNLDQDDLPTERALELKWNCKTDLLKLIVKGAKVSLTRRQLLCELASIFDPLGFIALIVFRMKLMLREPTPDKTIDTTD